MGKFHRRSKQKQRSGRKKLAGKASLKMQDLPQEAKTKDPGIPFKNSRSLGINKHKGKKHRQKQENKAKLDLLKRNYGDMLRDADEQGTSFSLKEELVGRNVPKEHRMYYKEFKKVVEDADIVLEVLDARDPLGSRCQQVEKSVIDSAKRLVLVLNKIDLVPRENMEKWLTYLRQEFPTIAFKASTQSQNDNLSQSKVAAIHMNENLQSSRRCIGASYLKKIIGNYCRNENILTSVKVGVVGFPNVGKSSIINSLKRSRSCAVGATPGVTKNVQEIIIDKHIRLLDSPGVVFASEGSSSSLALRNAIKIEKLDDVFTPAENIIQRADHAQLIEHYSVPEFDSSEQFFFHLATRTGCYKKGGIPNLETAARKLLNDWNSGIIKYHSQPPASFQPFTHISSELVQEMSKAFDISAMDEKMEMDKVPSEIDEDWIERASVKSDAMELDKGNDNKVVVKINPPKKAAATSEQKSEFAIPKQYVQNRLVKKAYKRMKKKMKKERKVAEALSKTMSSSLSLI